MEQSKVLSLLGTKSEVWKKILTSTDAAEVNYLFNSLLEYNLLNIDEALYTDNLVPPLIGENYLLNLHKICRKSLLGDKIKRKIFIKTYLLRKGLIKEKDLTQDKSKKNLIKSQIKNMESLLQLLARGSWLQGSALRVFFTYSYKKADKRILFAIFSFLWNKNLTQEDRQKLEKKVKNSTNPSQSFKLVLLSTTEDETWFNQEYETHIKNGELKLFEENPPHYPIFKAILNNHTLATSEMLETIFEKIIKLELVDPRTSFYEQNMLLLFRHPKGQPDFYKRLGEFYFINKMKSFN